jgi:hypothetical protein
MEGLESLLEDILIEIFSHLALGDLTRCAQVLEASLLFLTRQVSKRLNAICQDGSLWHSLEREYFIVPFLISKICPKGDHIH